MANDAGAFSESECKHFFKQMLKGLDYIHSSGFSHRDLKPENICLSRDFDIKIVDFGMAKKLEGDVGDGWLVTQTGTKAYMAPEILKKRLYSGEVIDLWALGVILFILYTGLPPFSLADPREEYYKMIKSDNLE